MSTTSTLQETIKVLIVDDQKLIRETLQLYLETQADLKVVGTAASGVTALEKIAATLPDVVILDLEMPGMSGITAIEIISDRYPEVKPIVLSSHDERDYINQAVLAGARGYFLKGTAPDVLIEAISRVHQGFFQLGSGLFDKLSFDAYDTTSQEPELTLQDLDIPVVTPVAELLQECESAPELECSELSFSEITVGETATSVEELQQQLEALQAKKAFIQQKYRHLKQNFSWLLVSQVVLFFITLGCTSYIVRMQGETTFNEAKSADTSQLAE